MSRESSSDSSSSDAPLATPTPLCIICEKAAVGVAPFSRCHMCSQHLSVDVANLFKLKEEVEELLRAYSQESQDSQESQESQRAAGAVSRAALLRPQQDAESLRRLALDIQQELQEVNHKFDLVQQDIDSFRSRVTGQLSSVLEAVRVCERDFEDVSSYKQEVATAEAAGDMAELLRLVQSMHESLGDLEADFERSERLLREKSDNEELQLRLLGQLERLVGICAVSSEVGDWSRDAAVTAIFEEIYVANNVSEAANCYPSFPRDDETSSQTRPEGPVRTQPQSAQLQTTDTAKLLQQGNQLKLYQKRSEAGRAFEAAAELFSKQRRCELDAANNYSEAANCYRKLPDTRAKAVRCLQQAAIAARQLEEAGDLLASSQQVEEAIDAYLRAADFWSGEDSPASAAGSRAKAGELMADCGRLAEAAAVFEDLGVSAEQHSLLSFGAKDHLAKSCLCLLCSGAAGVGEKAEQLVGLCSSFKDTDELSLVRSLALATDACDVAAVDAAVGEFERFNNLDDFARKRLDQLRQFVATAGLQLQ